MKPPPLYYVVLLFLPCPTEAMQARSSLVAHPARVHALTDEPLLPNKDAPNRVQGARCLREKKLAAARDDSIKRVVPHEFLKAWRCRVVCDNVAAFRPLPKRHKA